jgi:hypothetical protein
LSTNKEHHKFGSAGRFESFDYQSQSRPYRSPSAQRQRSSYDAVGPLSTNKERRKFESTGRFDNQSQGRPLRSPSTPYGGFEQIEKDEALNFLRRPVVRGRIVKQSGKRAFLQHHDDEEDEDYDENTTSLLDQPQRGFAKHIGKHVYPGSDHLNENDESESILFRQDLIPHDGSITPIATNSFSRGGDSMHMSLSGSRHADSRQAGSRYSGSRYSGPEVDDDNNQYTGSGIDSEEGLFIQENRYHRPPTVEQSPCPAGPAANAIPRRFTSNDYARDPASHPPAPQADSHFHDFGYKLQPSRYSGVPMPWGVQAPPQMVDQDEVTDAALLKRNLARGQGKKICKRSYGANDPENIAIVNMKENQNLSFTEIAQILNDQRVEQGKNPSLSSCGVNSRYNRTAPLLYASQGRAFVPLSQRKGAGRHAHGRSIRTQFGTQFVWSQEADLELVKCVKEVDSARWPTVASLFEERTGMRVESSAAALRHSLL